MKSLVTAAVAGLAGVTAMNPAEAGTFTVGNSLARDCWQAAEARWGAAVQQNESEYSG